MVEHFDVCRIETVGDCKEEIVDAVRQIKAALETAELSSRALALALHTIT